MANEQKALLDRFEESFLSLKQDLGFNADLDKLDDFFYLRDYVLQLRYVSLNLSRLICSRIKDVFSSWVSLLHGWVMPNPSSMISMEESKIFNDDEKKEMIDIIQLFMAHISKNTILSISPDEKAEAEFIDESIMLWEKNREKIKKFVEKIRHHWEMS